MRQGIAIYRFPVSFQEGAHQKQQGALGLMEIRYQHPNNLVFISGCDDDLCTGMKGFQLMGIQIVQQMGESLFNRNACHQFAVSSILVGLPLVHMQRLFRTVRMVVQLHTHVIQTLQCAHAGCSDSYGLAMVLEQSFEGMPVHHHIFAVHLMTGNLFRFHRLKRSGTHMKRHLIALYALGINGTQHSICKVQTCRWGCHRTFNLRINGLIGYLVALFGGTIQIRWNGKLPHRLQNFGKAHISSIPFKKYGDMGSVCRCCSIGHTRHGKGEAATFQFQCAT